MVVTQVGPLVDFFHRQSAAKLFISEELLIVNWSEVIYGFRY